MAPEQATGVLSVCVPVMRARWHLGSKKQVSPCPSEGFWGEWAWIQKVGLLGARVTLFTVRGKVISWEVSLWGHLEG